MPPIWLLDPPPLFGDAFSASAANHQDCYKRSLKKAVAKGPSHCISFLWNYCMSDFDCFESMSIPDLHLTAKLLRRLDYQPFAPALAYIERKYPQVDPVSNSARHPRPSDPAAQLLAACNTEHDLFRRYVGSALDDRILPIQAACSLDIPEAGLLKAVSSLRTLYQEPFHKVLELIIKNAAIAPSAHLVQQLSRSSLSHLLPFSPFDAMYTADDLIKAVKLNPHANVINSALFQIANSKSTHAADVLQALVKVSPDDLENAFTLLMAFLHELEQAICLALSSDLISSLISTVGILISVLREKIRPFSWQVHESVSYFEILVVLDQCSEFARESCLKCAFESLLNFVQPELIVNVISTWNKLAAKNVFVDLLACYSAISDSCFADCIPCIIQCLSAKSRLCLHAEHQSKCILFLLNAIDILECYEFLFIWSVQQLSYFAISLVASILPRSEIDARLLLAKFSNRQFMLRHVDREASHFVCSLIPLLRLHTSHVYFLFDVRNEHASIFTSAVDFIATRPMYFGHLQGSVMLYTMQELIQAQHRFDPATLITLRHYNASLIRTLKSSQFSFSSESSIKDPLCKVILKMVDVVGGVYSEFVNCCVALHSNKMFLHVLMRSIAVKCIFVADQAVLSNLAKTLVSFVDCETEINDALVDVLYCINSACHEDAQAIDNVVSFYRHCGFEFLVSFLSKHGALDLALLIAELDYYHSRRLDGLRLLALQNVYSNFGLFSEANGLSLYLGKSHYSSQIAFFTMNSQDYLAQPLIECALLEEFKGASAASRQQYHSIGWISALIRSDVSSRSDVLLSEAFSEAKSLQEWGLYYSSGFEDFQKAGSASNFVEIYDHKPKAPNIFEAASLAETLQRMSNLSELLPFKKYSQYLIESGHHVEAVDVVKCCFPAENLLLIEKHLLVAKLMTKSACFDVSDIRNEFQSALEIDKRFAVYEDTHLQTLLRDDSKPCPTEPILIILKFFSRAIVESDKYDSVSIPRLITLWLDFASRCSEPGELSSVNRIVKYAFNSGVAKVPKFTVFCSSLPTSLNFLPEYAMTSLRH